MLAGKGGYRRGCLTRGQHFISMVQPERQEDCLAVRLKALLAFIQHPCQRRSDLSRYPRSSLTLDVAAQTPAAFQGVPPQQHLEPGEPSCSVTLVYARHSSALALDWHCPSD